MEQTNFELYQSVNKDFWYIKSRNDLLERFIKKYFSTDYNVILDAGCGTGFNFELLRKYGNVTGIDNSVHAINACREQGFQVIMDDAEDTMFDNEQFDLVVAMDLIEHCDDTKLIKEFNRLLKSKGFVIFTVPAFKWLWSDDDDLAYHRRRYTLEQIKNLFESNGFNIEFISYRYYYIFMPTTLLFFWQKFRRMFSKQKKNSLAFTPKVLNDYLIRIMTKENKELVAGKHFRYGSSIIGVAKKL